MFKGHGLGRRNADGERGFPSMRLSTAKANRPPTPTMAVRSMRLN